MAIAVSPLTGADEAPFSFPFHGSERDAVLVTSLDGLRRAVADALRYPVVALDTETAAPEERRYLALNPDKAGLDSHAARIRLVQIATPDRVWLADAWRIGTLAPLEALLADERVEKVIMNAKFDLKMLRGSAGIRDVRGIFDPMLASQALACGHAADERHNLQTLAKRWLGIDLPKEEQASDWSGELRPEQIEYAARDAAVLLPLRDRLLEELQRLGLERCARLEFDAVAALADIEYNGFPIDLGMWEALGAKIKAERDAAAEALRALLPPKVARQEALFDMGEGWNLDSPAQVKEALDRAGISVPDTRDDTLRPLAAEYPVVARLLEHRRASKALSSFIEAYPQFIHPATGRIHADFWQCKSASGRVLCSNPNLQQPPHDRAFRECFRVSEGRAMVTGDFSQIELRIMAALSKDEWMLEAYHRGEDLHRLTASLVMGRPPDAVTKADRQAAKSVNFGLIYSMSPAGLALYARNSYGVDMSLEEAERFHRAFFTAYNGVAGWHRRARAFAEQHRYVKTRSGRIRRWLPGEPMRVGEVYNTPDQGTGADILKRAMARVRPLLLRAGAELIHSVHDELVVECQADAAEQVAGILTCEMAAAGGEFIPEVPVEVEAGIGRSWADKA